MMDSGLDDLDDSWFMDALMDLAVPTWKFEAKGNGSDIWDDGVSLGPQTDELNGDLADVVYRDTLLSIGLDAKGHQAGRDRVTYEQAENSSSASGSKGEEVSKQIIQRDCTACTDTYPESDTIRFPCEHYYCAKCIAELFEAAAKDESRFPPKCCGTPIPLAIAKSSLTASQILRFKQKDIEYATPNRTYCSREGCSAFIEPDSIKEDIATCGQCYQKTCANCKCKSHEGDCPEDIALESLVKKAQEKGWQRCFKCKRMVERVSGCNHMRCRCNTEFCYTCGQKWKTCSCKYNEVRRNTYVRPRPLRVRCDLCDSRFAVQPELRQHMDARHSQTDKVWICIDKSVDKSMLKDCKDCGRGRKYGTYYNAAAHLRRAHFGPRSRGEVGGRRGGPGGGMPPMREWIVQVDDVDVVVEHKKPASKPTATVAKAMNRADGPSTQPFGSFAIPSPVRMLAEPDMPKGPQAEHGVEPDSSKLQDESLQVRRPNCVHTHTPSAKRPTYSCTLCSGTICECDHCKMWFCYLCRFSTDLDLGFDAVNDSTFGYSPMTAEPSARGYGSGIGGLGYLYNAGSSVDECSPVSGFSFQTFGNSYNQPGVFDGGDNGMALFQASSSSFNTGSCLTGTSLLQDIKQENFRGRSSAF